MTDRSHNELADDAWRLIVEFMLQRGNRVHEIAKSLDLTPGDLHALKAISSDDPKPMGQLAAEWSCDASNVTWLVDRLEEKELVRREVLATDRRVKTVVLTPDGVAAQAEIQRRMFEAPSELRELSRDDLVRLVELLGVLAPAEAATGRAATAR